MQGLCLLLMTVNVPAAEADVAVVCPPAFRAAMAPWVEHRSRQGHRIVFATNYRDAEKIRAELRSIAKH
ncbi:MAG: hypothetical protein MI757_13440, partial [Pirellulales bacterium]|nr:hypothetical protein [Pirellulales bacterium]